MVEVAPDFSCVAPGLGSDMITEEAWILNSTGVLHRRSLYISATLQILYFAIGILWNVAVFAVILKKRYYSQPSYLLLLNLVMSDILVCVCALPFNVASVIANSQIVGQSDFARCQVCHATVIVTVTAIFVSLFTQALMSVDRLIYIRWMRKYSRIITVNTVLFLLILVWIFSFLTALPPFWGFGEIKFSYFLSSCSLHVVGSNRLGQNVYYVIVLVIVALIPFVTAVVADLCLLVTVSRNIRQSYNKQLDSVIRNLRSRKLHKEENVCGEFSPRYHKQQQLLAQVFVAIFAANTITLLPTVFLSITFMSVGSENVPPIAVVFVYLAILSQPVIHPLLETCLLGKVRSAITTHVCCCKRTNKEGNGVTKTEQVTVAT